VTSGARRPLILVIALVLLASACQQWPTMRGTPGNTGFNGSETELSLADAGTVTEQFRADLGIIQEGWQSPVISGSTIYAPTAGGLGAFDLNGASGCSGTPTTCQPMWTGDVGGRQIGSAVAVSGWTVFVTAGLTADNRLFAFDIRGENGCAGTPVVCQPLWTAPDTWLAAPTVDGSTVYIINGDARVAAYDANGVTGCGGSPKVCAPLWTTTQVPTAAPITAAIGGGKLFVSTFDDTIEAFDAHGIEGCGGSPKVCSSLWTGEVQGDPHFWPTSPVVSGDRVYLAMDEVDEDWMPVQPLRTIVAGFPLDGGGACTPSTGTGRSCQPAWSASFDGTVQVNEAAAAYGKLYFQAAGVATPFPSQLVVIDTTDPGCSPGPCGPAWTSSIGPDAGQVSPIVANGVVYLDRSGSIQAVDANGVTGCSGTPKVCASTTFSTFPGPYASGSAISNGRLAVITFDAQERFTLRVFG